MNNVPYGGGRALIDFNINICVMGRALPRVKRERHHNCDGQRQLLHSSAAAVFILSLVAHVVRMRARAPIIAKVLRLQEVARRRGRWRLQPVSWRRLGVRPMINASVNFVN